MNENEKPIFPGVVTNKMEDAIFSIKRELPFLIEYQKQMAIIIKAKYDAYIANGFTKEQALELCKASAK